MTCPFCEPKQRVLKENERAYVMLSNPRKVDGHFLVIPKRHIEAPWEMGPEEVQDVFELISFVQQKLVNGFAQGSDVRQHHRPFLKESRTKVNHVHYQILPRMFQDTLHQHNTEDKLWGDLPQEEHDRIAKLLD